jgi:hypothetical protein
MNSEINQIKSKKNIDLLLTKYQYNRYLSILNILKELLIEISHLSKYFYQLGNKQLPSFVSRNLISTSTSTSSSNNTSPSAFSCIPRLSFELCYFESYLQFHLLSSTILIEYYNQYDHIKEISTNQTPEQSISMNMNSTKSMNTPSKNLTLPTSTSSSPSTSTSASTSTAVPTSLSPGSSSHPFLYFHLTPLDIYSLLVFRSKYENDRIAAEFLQKNKPPSKRASMFGGLF